MVGDVQQPGSALTPEEDRIYGAAYAASLIRTMGFWLIGATGLTLVPIVGGFFGLVLIAGIAILFCAIPVRSFRWRARYGELSPDHPEMRKARGLVLQGLLLWMASPLVFLAVGAVSLMLGHPPRSVGERVDAPTAHVEGAPQSGVGRDSAADVRTDTELATDSHAGTDSDAGANDESLPEFGTYVYVEELPVPLTKVAPDYPDEARAAGVEGTVLVQALVGRDGKVKDARIAKSIPMLNGAALRAIRQWVFKPAQAAQKPVAVWVTVPVRFTLDP